MNILIPVNTNNYDKCQISDISHLSYWLLIDLVDGKIKTSNFYRSRSEINEWIDYLIVSNKDEDVQDYFDEGIAVLFAPFQEELDEVLEAFLFKDLHEINKDDF